MKNMILFLVRCALPNKKPGMSSALYGPFAPLLRSPEVMQNARRMGEHLR